MMKLIYYLMKLNEEMRHVALMDHKILVLVGYNAYNVKLQLYY
jgi:hypothetical protein